MVVLHTFIWGSSSLFTNRLCYAILEQAESAAIPWILPRDGIP